VVACEEIIQQASGDLPRKSLLDLLTGSLLEKQAAVFCLYL